MNSEPDMPRRRLPGRADVLGFFSRVVWRTRNPRAQRVAGEASAENAVHLDSATDAAPEVAPGTRPESAPETGLHPASETAPLGTPGAPETPEAPERRPDPDTAAAAFFDVDNTLVQGASIILLARGLAKHKFFTAADIVDMAWTQLKFRISGTENPDDVAAGREKALSFVTGRTVSELDALCEEVVDDTMLDRVWPGTHAIVKKHLDAGQQVWLVTATPVELARVIATRLGLSGALGTVTESEDGVYTGRLVGDILHGPGKAHAVRRLAEDQGFDLSRCYAYSDSHNDVPMLSLVGNPVAINPDSRLRDHAREQGWDVKDFRTVRKAAKKAFPGVLAVGGMAGATAAVRSARGERVLRAARGLF